MVVDFPSTIDDGGYGSLRSQGRRDSSDCFVAVPLRELPHRLPQLPRLDRIYLQRDVAAVDSCLRKRTSREPQARLRNAIMGAKTSEEWYGDLAWLYGGTGLAG